MLHTVWKLPRPQVLYLPDHGIIVKELTSGSLNGLL